jgi:hypothetical protein
MRTACLAEEIAVVQAGKTSARRQAGAIRECGHFLAELTVFNKSQQGGASHAPFGSI